MNGYSTLCLVYTDKCNASCSICSFGCSPNNSAKISVNDAKEYIEEAVKVCKIARLAITGGEPFLYYEELKDIINYASERGVAVTCNTNGFWAKTLNETGNKIVELMKVGLGQLTVSVDQYHLDYIPIENIRNIIKATKLLKLQLVLECVVLKNSKRVWDITKELGDCISDVSIIERLCLPFGTAKSIDSEEFFFNDISISKCGYADVMTILPNKKVYSCCSEGGFTEAMKSADLNIDSIQSAAEVYASNKLIFLMKNIGISWLIEEIKEQKLDIEMKENYVNICDVCYDLFKSEKNIEILKPLIDQKFDDILAIINSNRTDL